MTDTDEAVSGYRGLDIEGTVGRFVHALFTEVEFLGDGLYRLVQQDICPFDDDYMVQQAVDVLHLMGRYDDGLFVGHAGSDGFSELAFRRNVQSVGRFVHQKQGCIGGQGKTEVCLLLLSHGKFS